MPKIRWVRVDRKLYWAMLELLFPAAMASNAFLVGEAACHDASGTVAFDAFLMANGRYYKSSRPLTFNEFKSRFADARYYYH